MKKLVMILFAALLFGAVGLAAPLKGGTTGPITATIDGWTPWANSITPPPPPDR